MTVLLWFDANPFRYYALGCGAMLVTLVLAVLPAFGSGRYQRRYGASLLFLGAALLTLLAFRWPPLFVPYLINPDEAQMIAQALTLVHYPIPWKDYDGTTSGPFNSAVLIWPRFLGLGIGYFSARLTTVALSFGVLVGLYVAVRNLYGEVPARLGVLLPLAFFATTTHVDFVCYASEVLSVFLATVAAALLAAFLRRSERWAQWQAFAIGVLATTLLFCKLQVIPIAFVLFALALGVIIEGFPRASRVRLILRLFEGALVVPLLLLVLVAPSGALHDAVISYLLAPLAYAAGGPNGFPAGYPLYKHFAVFAGSAVAIALAAFVLYAAMSRAAGDRTLDNWRPVAATLLLLLAAFYAIVQPHLSFVHYLYFAVPPVAGCVACIVGVVLVALQRTTFARLVPSVALLLALIAVVPSLWRTVTAENPYLGHLAAFRAFQGYPVDQMLTSEIQPGERVAVWGWAPQYFVVTQAVMGTRDSIGHFQILPSPYRDYYRQRYLEDLRTNRPPFFVDAVSPHMLLRILFDWKTNRYESFPALKAYVNAHYHLQAETDGVRLFARNG